MDQMGVVSQLAVWSVTVREREHLSRGVGLALHHAAARRGPAILEIPLDVQLARVEDPGSLPGPEVVPSELGLTETRQASEMLLRAERPVAIVGEGAFWSGAHEALQRFAEKTQVPVFTLRAARGLLPDAHEFC